MDRRIIIHSFSLHSNFKEENLSTFLLQKPFFILMSQWGSTYVIKLSILSPGFTVINLPTFPEGHMIKPEKPLTLLLILEKVMRGEEKVSCMRRDQKGRDFLRVKLITRFKDWSNLGKDCNKLVMKKGKLINLQLKASAGSDY